MTYVYTFFGVAIGVVLFVFHSNMMYVHDPPIPPNQSIVIIANNNHKHTLSRETATSTTSFQMARGDTGAPAWRQRRDRRHRRRRRRRHRDHDHDESSQPQPQQQQDNGGEGKKCRVLLFTMDSLSHAAGERAAGGAGGEYLIRKHLQDALHTNLGFEVVVASSDDEFAAHLRTIDKFDMFVVDQWTVYKPGWIPHDFAQQHPERTFVLDFFGTPERAKRANLRVPVVNFLTPYPYNDTGNTFIGFPVHQMRGSGQPYVKNSSKPYGIVWGKERKYFEGSALRLLQGLVDDRFDFHSSLPPDIHVAVKMHQHGPLSHSDWHDYMRGARFIIGLGDPIYGPSVLQAIAAGVMYINPVYTPVRQIQHDQVVNSQHPYASHAIGEPHVCNYAHNSIGEARKCIDQALKVKLSPYIPPAFQHDNYEQRIFDLFRNKFNYSHCVE